MKYIIVEDHFGVQSPIVFEELLDHSAVASNLPKTVAAGFCRFIRSEPGFQCWGESVSIGKRSRLPQDELILDNFFNV